MAFQWHSLLTRVFIIFIIFAFCFSNILDIQDFEELALQYRSRVRSTLLWKRTYEEPDVGSRCFPR